MSNKPKIEGVCPYCGKGKVKFCTQDHSNGKGIAMRYNVPMCEECWSDDIEIRKINNRRYKVVGKL